MENKFRLDCVKFDDDLVLTYDVRIVDNKGNYINCGELTRNNLTGAWRLYSAGVTLIDTNKNYTVQYNSNEYEYKFTGKLRTVIEKLQQRFYNYSIQVQPDKLTDYNPYYVFNGRKKHIKHILKDGRRVYNHVSIF